VKIINVVGARPNFMKMAPIIEELNKHPQAFNHLLVHTGQHYDEKMNTTFFDDLRMPKPDIDLEIGSGTHAEQTGKIMVAFEQVCYQENPDLVIVVGDVNSTMACAITAKKLGIKVAHVEAGLRSRDMQMPEEINRLCTDIISDFLFTTDRIASQNLLQEGISADKIFFVGNAMIDTLFKHKALAKNLDLRKQLGLKENGYGTLTLHRPANVDNPVILEGILKALNQIAEELPIVFPAHPRTIKMIEKFDLAHYLNRGESVEGIWATEPLGYLDFLHLNMSARIVLTDSGGLQEETTVLGVPCITLRHNTERPITCEEGTNQIVGNAPDSILKAVDRVLNNVVIKQPRTPDLWDGKAAERIVHTLMKGL